MKLTLPIFLSLAVAATATAAATGSAPAAPKPPFESYIPYLLRRGSTQAAAEAADNLATTEFTHLWEQKDDPDFAAYLLAQKPILDRLVAASNRPKWWVPVVPVDGRSLISAAIPTPGRLRDGVNCLCARATLRAANHDFPGFLADISACLRFAHLLNGPDTIDCLVAIALEQQTDKAIATVAAAGNFTAPQIAALQTLLQNTTPLPSLHDATDTYERWMVLDRVALLLTHHLSLGDAIKQVSTLTIDNLDGDALLRQINADFDDQLRAMSLPTLAQRRAAFQARAATLESADKTAGDDWSAQPGESRAAYTARIGPALRYNVIPHMSAAGELERRAYSSHQLTAVVLAAAVYKVHEGHWPDSLHTLIPKDLAAIPQNPWYPDQPLQYTLTKNGPTLSISTSFGALELGATP
jgi:hypothetical protein